MKKTKKRILGLLGLILVAIITIFAAFLPGSETSAVGATSVTDTITVRVVGSVPDINITSPSNNSVFIVPDLNFSFNYENVGDVLVKVKYTDKDGILYDYTLAEFDANYDPGTYSEDLKTLLEEQFGYGKYVISAKGIGFIEGEDGQHIYDEDLVEFWFYPVVGEAAEDNNDGLVYLDLTYDKENENIKTIGINVYDEGGNLVKVISPITVKAPGDRVELPFSENDLASGNYKIEITAYDAEGNALYKPYVTYFYYETLPAPDTGAVFGNLNISKTDYLVTGLLIFLSAAVLGIIFITKDRGSKKRATVGRRRRK